MPLYNLPIPELTPSFIEGMGAQHVSATQTKIVEGVCRDSVDTKDIEVTSQIFLTMPATSGGSLDTGSRANNTWYAQHVIADSSGVNPVAGRYSLSATAPTLPAGYDLFRRQGWVRTDGVGALEHYNVVVASGNYREVIYAEREEGTCEVLTAGASTAYAAVSLAALIPPTSRNGILIVSTDGDADFEGVLLRYTGSAVVTPVSRIFSGGIGGRSRCTAMIRMRISSSQSIDYRNSVAGNATYIWVQGYVDTL